MSLSSEKIFISQQENIFFIDSNEIIFLKSDNCYTNLYFKGGRTILVSKSLSKFQKELHAEKFIKVNQSFLVNKQYWMC